MKWMSRRPIRWAGRIIWSWYKAPAHSTTRSARPTPDIGVWVDNLTAETTRLVGEGWTVLAAGASPEEGYGMIAYVSPPVPGLLVELISTDLKPVIDDWLGE